VSRFTEATPQGRRSRSDATPFSLTVSRDYLELGLSMTVQPLSPGVVEPIPGRLGSGVGRRWI